jgi:hypothetical protein
MHLLKNNNNNNNSSIGHGDVAANIAPIDFVRIC